MTKVDFKKTCKQLYAPSSKDFSVVEVPDMTFLMVDGHGDPNTATSYKEAVEALYAVSYKLKFMSKKELDKDYVVPPLEGLWWADDMDSFTAALDKSKWDWTMMVMLPEWLTDVMFTRALEDVTAKKHLPALPLVRMERYAEGTSAQILHIGAYNDEGPTLARLHYEWLPEHGYTFNGKHHEIYLSDPRKVASEKLKTILRQPVRPVKAD